MRIALILLTLVLGAAAVYPLSYTGGSIDPIRIQTRVGDENRYEFHKEIQQAVDMDSLKQILEGTSYRAAKIEWQHPPKYQLNIQSEQYYVWYTNGYAEIYKPDTHLYSKLDLETSGKLGELIQ
ncbi:hypothetical protein [Paenibacillus lemnae]|uniref:Uncharacterized protein n=1 Tax=Paenibacillus lemnae TaxID=1330551 RepID=A0A848M9F2_PAELE|nr:hypothetical protein [Paenibacillus lemnae]NMO96124.1 hypothetical protein [Paenibacillus lemnae]